MVKQIKKIGFLAHLQKQKKRPNQWRPQKLLA